MKKYKITEIFTSIQGEGSLSGTVQTFIRFQDCNLHCSFCDTDFSYGTEMTVDQILSEIKSEWVCLTGGEPLLQTGQWDDELMDALVGKHKIALETNGTLKLSHHGFDHVCMSPKVPMDKIKLNYYNEVKVIYPTYEPEQYYTETQFRNHYIQPEFGKEKLAIDYVIKNPHWKLSVQTHKFLEIK